MDLSEYYHVYNRANGNENLFLSDDNYLFFLNKYSEHIYPVCKTYAYCLMPNHFHFLVKTRDEEEIRSLMKLDADKSVDGKTVSKQFSNFFSCYTQAFNKMYQRKGSLFMKNFKRKPIKYDAYFTKVIHYIHFNPVHHGFVRNIENWQWSSYHSFISESKTLLERNEVLNWYDGRIEFLRFHQQPIDKRLELELEL